MSKTPNKHPPDMRERVVRVVLDNGKDHASRWVAVVWVAATIGCAAQTLHGWVDKVEVDSGLRAGAPTDWRPN